MPTPTYDLIASQTLSASASSVTFSSIPTSGYRDLVLVIDHAMNTAEGIALRVNGDTGSNYSEINVFVRNSTTITSGSGTGTAFIATYTSGNQRVLYTVQFLDYSATDKHKSVIARMGSAGSSGPSITVNGMYGGRWANTAAINSITVFSAASIISGSTFNLYGIAS